MMCTYAHLPGDHVLITNPADLGRAARHARRERGMTQSQLSAAADVSRRWLADFEAGKPTAEVGLVFRVVHALGLVIELSPWSAPDLDLDEVIRTYGQAAGTDKG
jgi:transcriptional regulator with XRE-family HTH domain